MGVNFVLYKPLAYDRALSSLRAARAVMRKEKRKKARATVHAHATHRLRERAAGKSDADRSGGRWHVGAVWQEASSGQQSVFSVQAAGIRRRTIRLSGQVVWQDWKGRAGVQFVDVPKASRRCWMIFSARICSAQIGRRATVYSDVTVEVEESLQPAAVAVAAITHGASKRDKVKVK